MNKNVEKGQKFHQFQSFRLIFNNNKFFYHQKMEKLFLLLTIFIIVSKGIYSKETENRKILSQLCPKGFLRLGHSCYYFSADMMTWQEAYFDCLHREGTLTSIESPWEDLLLRTYLNNPQLARLNRWIGGEYNWLSKNWIWGASGKPMRYLGFPPRDVPLGGHWQCVYLSPSLLYRWNFASCFSIMHYICKAPQRRIIDETNKY
ncbi:Low affinity immunoglobulin epsilon Fc receptor [Armadillidium vulgare]|nr:Low affinity immunoglobulin epsilon Fc receptor [Armadillidium vulgare]